MFLRSWVRIPPGAWIFVCCECRVLSGRGLCDELITRPEESYRLCCVVVYLETSRMGAPYIYIYIYIYDISHLRVNDWFTDSFIHFVIIIRSSFVLIHYVVSLATHPQPLPKRFMQLVYSSASSFQCKCLIYFLEAIQLLLMSSSSSSHNFYLPFSNKF